MYAQIEDLEKHGFSIINDGSESEYNIRIVVYNGELYTEGSLEDYLENGRENKEDDDIDVNFGSDSDE